MPQAMVSGLFCIMFGAPLLQFKGPLITDPKLYP